MYFKRVPNVYYDYTIRSDKQKIIDVVSDITTRVSLSIKPENLSVMCETYLVADFDTPEQIALRKYGDPLLHWTILYINEIADIYSDWPMSEVSLQKFCEEKYGSAINDTAYSLKLPEQIVMDKIAIEKLYGSEYVYDVSNMEHERQINEQKRLIKLIKPIFIGKFVSEYLSKLTV